MESSRGGDGAVGGRFDAGVVRGCPVETPSVRSFLHALAEPRIAWADATSTVAAGGAAATIAADGPGRFATVREEATRLFGQLETVGTLPRGARPRLYGGFAFTDDHTDPPVGDTWHGYPGAKFVLPAVQCTVSADGAWLTTAALGPGAEQRATELLGRWRDRFRAVPELGLADPPGIADLTYTPTRAGWNDQVASATGRIRQGDLRKVVLAQSLTARLDGPVVVPDALARLGETYPGCHRFMFESESGRAFFGATPERLVSLRGDRVDTEALAGSTGRGETQAEDEWLATQLGDSEKDTHEHELVVGAVRDQLDALTESIRTGERSVRQLATVQHLQTPLRATLSRETHVLELVEALHPTPAVGGLPPDEALRTIRESEAFDRGWYAAPVGWIDADGDGTFAVGLRSAVADGRTASLFAGAGIVADSEPEQEWDELQLKYRPILDELA